MAPDGELSVDASFFRNTQHYNLGFQILPWLEGAFRYSGLQHFNPNYPVYYDRSFALKARLWDETDIFPAVAIGVNDVVGTGIYSGEYLVASKRFGDFDTTLGIGWGRLGSTALFSNPLTAISNSLRSRPTLTAPGGTNFNVFFHGPSSSLFGGIVWYTPIDGLSLIGEYSSDVYSLETARGNFKPRSQMNLGASYQVTDGISLGLDWLYGTSIAGSISFQMDPTKPQYPTKITVPPPPVHVRTPKQQQQALNLLLQQRNGAQIVDARGTVSQAPRITARMDKNIFVNRLFDSQYDDVQVRGTTLLLAVQGIASSRQCHAVAQLAQFYGADIYDIVLDSGARQRVHCHVQAQVSAQPASYIAPQNAYLAPQETSFDTSLDPPGTDDPTPGAAAKAIRAALAQQKISTLALSLGSSEAILYYANLHYFSEAEAVGRIVRVLMADAPPTIEKFRLISVVNGIPQQEFNVLRAPMERSLTRQDQTDIWNHAITITPPAMQTPVLDTDRQSPYPHFSWMLFPQFRQNLFDPNNPFQVQFLAGLAGSAELFPGFSLNAEVESNLYDNFDVNRLSNSQLPHVRSDFVKYFSEGKNGIGDLEADYRFRLAPDVFAIARAGYLESMFAGVGGEVLWRPQGQRWALGADLYDVRQRDFNRLFGLQSYQIMTGHISLYYQSPWHQLNFSISAGQYLAGDRGVTFQVTRRFSTGVEIGAFFTKTNVSASQFGEGSFDKGIIIRIPLGWAAPIETQGQLNMDLRPIQRDGGQRLTGDATLYGETQRTSEGEIRSHLNAFIDSGE